MRFLSSAPALKKKTIMSTAPSLVTHTYALKTIGAAAFDVERAVPCVREYDLQLGFHKTCTHVGSMREGIHVCMNCVSREESCVQIRVKGT
jgi:hypothetical protein